MSSSEADAVEPHLRRSSIPLLAASLALVACADADATRPVAMDVHYDYAVRYTVCDWHFDPGHRTTHSVIQGASTQALDQGSSEREFTDLVAIARKATARRTDIEHPGPAPMQDPAHPYDPWYLITITKADGTREVRSMPYSWGNPSADQLALLKVLDPRWGGPARR